MRGCQLPARFHVFVWSTLLMLTLCLLGISRNNPGRNVWAGWRESSELRRPAYAERVYVNEAIRTRANTWSNLAYVLVGLYAITIGWHDHRNPSPTKAGGLATHPSLSLTFGLACCYLGLGSGLFHASLTRLGQQLDVAAMYAPLLALIALNMGRWIPRLKLRQHPVDLPSWPMFVALVVTASVLLFLYKWSMSSVNVLGTLIATIGLLGLLDRFRTTSQLDARWLAWSSGALGGALLCRHLDIAGRFSGPDSWLQGHALWHILTSLSLGCMYLYNRSETSIPTTKSLPAIDPPTDSMV
jgi:hypothetical protein